MSHDNENETKATVTRVAGYLAEYTTPAAVMHAAEKIRDAGYSKWDVNTPFPIHGMDAAMGIKPTPLGWISFCGGLTGGSLGMLMEWWMNAVDYPLNIGGKPAFAPPAFVPVSYELTILLTAFATIFGMLGLNRLPQLYHWAFYSKRFERATDDRFFITIEAEDPKFNSEKTRKDLEDTHPHGIEEISETFATGGGGLRENIGLTIEAIAGISSPLGKGAQGDKEH